ncbi:hypothetical protein QJS10_CPA03g01312 [Acorus calamus]|uniref:Uncharacterized protein n=1 Tax=Acorus calamus TaxID=4465 RepID=A0AAV9FAE7_ACOCL|nr:hypothetical protein QJS10_CPA03g01312 [Acorus calamus]
MESWLKNVTRYQKVKSGSKYVVWVYNMGSLSKNEVADQASGATERLGGEVGGLWRRGLQRRPAHLVSGNGYVGAENQCVGLVRALGLSNRRFPLRCP